MIVMPRSRSRSIESITRSTTASFSRCVPVCFSIASTRVVFPWSTWAIMAMFLICSELCIVRNLVKKRNKYSDGLAVKTQKDYYPELWKRLRVLNPLSFHCFGHLLHLHWELCPLERAMAATRSPNYFFRTQCFPPSVMSLLL